MTRIEYTRPLSAHQQDIIREYGARGLRWILHTRAEIYGGSPYIELRRPGPPTLPPWRRPIYTDRATWVLWYRGYRRRQRAWGGYES